MKKQRSQNSILVTESVILVYLQTELWYDGNQMIEYIRLDPFVVFPHFVAGEEIDFYRKPIFGDLLLRNDQVKMLIDLRDRPQITFGIVSEELCVGGLLLRLRLVIFQERDVLADLFNHVCRTEVNGIQIHGNSL